MILNLPNRMALANLPTKIEPLKLSSEFKNIDVYIKRDDQTGFELSGNKVRKLEFIMQDLIDNDYTHVITCGALQSNHVRATAACAAKLGIKCTAVLKGTPIEEKCNYYMTNTFGADIKLLDPKITDSELLEVMSTYKDAYEKDGHKAYIIPTGASTGLGNLGYFTAFEEIIKEESVIFDILSVPVGSCGTYAGLFLANAYHKMNRKILGINIYDSEVDFSEKTKTLIKESNTYISDLDDIDYSQIDIRSDYVGEGYAKTSDEVHTFMKAFSKREGVLLDPVYTGKGFYGLYQELKKLDAQLTEHCNVLFIHTGGTFMY